MRGLTLDYRSAAPPGKTRWRRWLLIFLGGILVLAVGMALHENAYLASLQSALRSAHSDHERIATVDQWVEHVCKKGAPKEVFKLIPDQAVRSHGAIQFIVLQWDRPYYLWANNESAGLTDLDVTKYVERMGSMPWPDVPEDTAARPGDKGSQR